MKIPLASPWKHLAHQLTWGWIVDNVSSLVVATTMIAVASGTLATVFWAARLAWWVASAGLAMLTAKRQTYIEERHGVR